MHSSHSTESRYHLSLKRSGALLDLDRRTWPGQPETADARTSADRRGERKGYLEFTALAGILKVGETGA